jgi:hypothetical protein
MNVFNTLVLVNATKVNSLSSIQQKRNKLSIKILEQMHVCEAEVNNTVYAPKKLRTFINKTTNESTLLEVNKRIRKWYWLTSDGKYNLCIKYGSRTLTLNKDGKNAIELKDKQSIINTLKLLSDAVLNGELDSAIINVSVITKKGFHKK